MFGVRRPLTRVLNHTSVRTSVVIVAVCRYRSQRDSIEFCCLFVERYGIESLLAINKKNLCMANVIGESHTLKALHTHTHAHKHSFVDTSVAVVTFLISNSPTN